jgi:DNA invertase Pin-like site-specific DNA recombinase
MSSHLSIRDRWRIISLRFDQGIAPNEIASIINCSRTTVFNILQLFHETNDVTEREGRGRTLLNNRR